jgi:hypothetical protein
VCPSWASKWWHVGGTKDLFHQFPGHHTKSVFGCPSAKQGKMSLEPWHLLMHKCLVCFPLLKLVTLAGRLLHTYLRGENIFSPTNGNESVQEIGNVNGTVTGNCCIKNIIIVPVKFPRHKIRNNTWITPVSLHIATPEPLDGLPLHFILKLFSTLSFWLKLSVNNGHFSRSRTWISARISRVTREIYNRSKKSKKP